MLPSQFCLASCGQRSSPSAAVPGTSTANQSTAKLQPLLPLHAGTRYLSSCTEPALTQLAQQPCQSGTAVNRAALNATPSPPAIHAHPISISLSTIIPISLSASPELSTCCLVLSPPGRTAYSIPSSLAVQPAACLRCRSAHLRMLYTVLLVHSATYHPLPR